RPEAGRPASAGGTASVDLLRLPGRHGPLPDDGPAPRHGPSVGPNHGQLYLGAVAVRPSQAARQGIGGTLAGDADVPSVAGGLPPRRVVLEAVPPGLCPVDRGNAGPGGGGRKASPGTTLKVGSLIRGSRPSAAPTVRAGRRQVGGLTPAQSMTTIPVTKTCT